MNFKEWFEQADIPMKDEKGNWYDAETGLPFKEEIPKVTRSRSKETKKTSTKMKPLRGSVKQKDWANSIRNTLLKSATTEQVSMLMNLTITQYSTFWINRRSMSLSNLIAEAQKCEEKLYFAKQRYNEADEKLQATADHRGLISKQTEEYAAREKALKDYEAILWG